MWHTSVDRVHLSTSLDCILTLMIPQPRLNTILHVGAVSLTPPHPACWNPSRVERIARGRRDKNHPHRFLSELRIFR